MRHILLASAAGAVTAAATLLLMGARPWDDLGRWIALAVAAGYLVALRKLGERASELEWGLKLKLVFEVGMLPGWGLIAFLQGPDDLFWLLLLAGGLAFACGLQEPGPRAPEPGPGRCAPELQSWPLTPLTPAAASSPRVVQGWSPAREVRE